MRPGAVLALLPLLAAGGCAAVVGLPPTPQGTCPAGTAAATVADAYFGRNIGLREGVTDADWARFLAEEATPRFPDGLTVLDGQGQWRRADGTIARERSKVLVVVLPGVEAEVVRARLAPLVEAYKARFRQDSVLTVLRPACIG
jgi:hypothetical protein